MLFKKFRIPSIVFTLIMLGSGCAPPIPADRVFDQGHITDHTYINDYFGLRIRLPEDWVVQNEEQMKALRELGADAMTDDKEKALAMRKAAEVTSANLLVMFRDEVGVTAAFNPSFMLLAENVQLHKDMSAQTYLASTIKLLQTTAIPYVVEGDLPAEKLDGKEFVGMTVSASTNGIAFKQEYRTTITDGFALSTILTYAEESQRDSLLTIFKGLHFGE